MKLIIGCEMFILDSRKEIFTMCEDENKEVCKHPEKLKGKPGECSPEQIRECHGETAEHPCVESN